MEEFAQQCKERGYDIDVSSAGALHKSLLQFQNNRTIDPITHYALTTSATVPMKPAVYFAAGTESREAWRHYALNIPYYTHFTSPIRRYADIMVRTEGVQEWERGGGCGLLFAVLFLVSISHCNSFFLFFSFLFSSLNTMCCRSHPNRCTVC